MAIPRFAWGIDIGNGALKAVKLVRENGQLKVADFEYIEHEQVLSNAGDNRDDLIRAALANFVARHPIKGGVAAVSVSGQQSFARFIKLPPVEEKKIPEIVRFEAIQQIPFPLDDVEWSYQLFRAPDSPDIEVGIFAMRKELIAAHIKQFSDVDLNVQVVQMNPLAVYNAMYYDGRLKGTTMIVDLGAENTDLIIADGETVWLRSIPIGGNNFTEALVKAFKLNFAKAEDLKRNAATSKYARQIFQAMRPVFADLVSEIQRSIGFYASVHRDSRIERVLALGGTFRMPTLQKYLQQNLQLDVEKLDRYAAGAPDDPKMATTFNDHVLSLTGAYGLAVQAMGEGKITSSLLPQSIRRAKMWQEKTKWFGAAAACFVAASGVAYGALWAKQDAPYSAAAGDRNQIQQILSRAQGLDQRWSEIESSGQADRVQIANVSSLLNYRDLWTSLLSDIYRALPNPEGWDHTKADPEAIKKIPREQRNLVVIDSVNMQYLPDVSPLLARSDEEFRLEVQRMMGTPGNSGGRSNPWGSRSGWGSSPRNMMGSMPVDGEVEAGSTAPARRGLLVTITGTTPFAAGQSGAFGLIQNTLIKSLGQITPDNREGRDYYVEKVMLISGTRVLNSQQMRQRILAANQNLEKLKAGEVVPTAGGTGYRPNQFGGMYEDYNEGFTPPPTGGFGRNFGGFPGQNTGGPNAQTVTANDPLTGESMDNDLEYRVAFVVVLDLPSERPPAEETEY